MEAFTSAEVASGWGLSALVGSSQASGLMATTTSDKSGGGTLSRYPDGRYSAVSKRFM
jgi:hypothetical protein